MGNQNTRNMVIGGVIGAVAVLALVGAFWLGSRSSGADPAAPVAVATTAMTVAPATTVATLPATTAPAVTSTTAAPVSVETPVGTIAPNVATLVATLDGPVFTLDAVVPNQRVANRLIAAATVAYGEDIFTDITVDPSVPAAPWTSQAHLGIPLLTVLGEGTITATGDAVSLEGSAATQEDLNDVSAALQGTFGVAEVASDVTITNLGEPSLKVDWSDGILTMQGELPNEEFRAIIESGAVALHGENVRSNIEINAGTSPKYWMYTIPGIMELLSIFPGYEFTIQDGQTSGSLLDGALFASGSSSLEEETQLVLNIAVAILQRDPTLGMRVEGHTDSDGSSGLNQQLSEARANTTIDFLVAAGIDPARLLGVGFGEDRPIADNSTDDGRARNRRVEFAFGPVTQVLNP